MQDVSVFQGVFVCFSMLFFCSFSCYSINAFCPCCYFFNQIFFFIFPYFSNLFQQHVFSEPFEPSPFMPSSTASFDGDNNLISNKQLRGQGQADADAPSVSTAFDKGTVPKENNVAKLRVVVSI